MLRRIWAVARKELLQVVHDPRALAVAIVMPPMMIVLYGYGVNLDVRNVPLAVCDRDRSVLSRDLTHALEPAAISR